MSANKFGRLEWAGAFGDLGTLIPFVVSYLTIVKMDPFAVLFCFGLSMLASGLVYQTPFPVQPMKAIGAIAATQAAQTAVITPATIAGAALMSGLIWLLLGASGATARLARWVPPCVVVGIVAGLGLGFMLEGIRMMSDGWLVAAVGLGGTLALLKNKTVPAMLLLLAFGVACGLLQHPALRDSLWALKPQIHVPTLALAAVGWKDYVIGATLLALPQLPLTLGNAVIAIKDENNRLFPDHPVTEDAVALSTGAMNLLSAVCGGVPMCHGAGGMAGHVAFGARTGGAPIILGIVLLLVAVFLSDSLGLLLQLLPRPVLGVALFLAGAHLAAALKKIGDDRHDRFITIITAACSLWNVGLALLVGLLLSQITRRNLLGRWRGG